MRVLVVANDHVGTQMAGPGIRAWRFAEGLASKFDVTLSVPFATDLQPDSWKLATANPYSAREMTEMGRDFDVVVAQRLPVSTMRSLSGTTRMVYDLYVPSAIEYLAYDALNERSRKGLLSFRLNMLEYQLALASGDAFVCASEVQR